MLRTLTIQNVVLIEYLNIEFQTGLCALTGETGAGKSILLDALGLALGARSERALLRKGAERAVVNAVFELSPDHDVYTLLKQSDILCEPEEDIILRRVLLADGRSKAYINDQNVSASLLRRVGDELIEIHGQFDTQRLLNPATHRMLLDDYAGLGKDKKLFQAWESWKKAREELEHLQEETARTRADEAYLRSAIEDLDELNPQEGEEAELEALRARLINREQVLEALNTAYQALNGEHDPVRSAWGALERIADKMGEEIKAPIEALDRAAVEIQEALFSLQELSEKMNEDERNLEDVDERLHLLKAQARKHSCGVDELSQIREELAQRLEQIEYADERVEKQMHVVKQTRDIYIKTAQDVTQKRCNAALALDKAVQKELAPLKLDKARFVTKVIPLPEEEWGERGCEQVHFLVSTNLGAEPGALDKIASGGEMSRFMLALKVVTAQTGGAARTLIFDEVDAGIGGAVAAAVGERLARLSLEQNQVLVVTHAPQVAARAAHHWIIAKDGVQEVKTNVSYLPQRQERREEIARMLAGAQITQEARAAADKLLEMGH